MRAWIALHSTTGNTRLVARYAARRLERQGFDVTVQDIVRDPTPPDLSDVDLIGVAFPVMYFRPTLALERFVEKLAPKDGTPAFVLATAGGNPGAALHLAAEQLEGLGATIAGAHWTTSPSNWSTQLTWTRRLKAAPVISQAFSLTTPLARKSWTALPSLKPYLAFAWEEAAEPDLRDRQALERFLDETVGNVLAHRAGAPLRAPNLAAMASAAFITMGRRTNVSKAAASLQFRASSAACNRCGACVAVCPAGCVEEVEGSAPRFHEGCTGCYACYNACAHDAVSAKLTPPGGRYSGPPKAMRELFGDRK